MKNKTLILIVVLIAAALFVTACGTPAPKGDLVNGKTEFEGTCSSCHGPDAKGMPDLGKDLTTSEFVKSKTDEEMIAFLLVGRPAYDPLNTTKVDMPPKGGNPALTDTDLQDIISYVRSLQK